MCNLGALNLAAFVHGPTGAGELDYAALAEHARVAMRFLDNVVDANLYFIEENREAQLGTRRTGLGTMGLADALIGLGVRYGSDESLAVVDRIYRTIRDAAYDMSADIAAEKDAFGHFDREQYLRGEFIRELPAAIQEKIGRQGIRNAVLLTQAPTGTTSLLAGVSSGIEPVFDFAMVRRDRTGEHVMYHPLLQAWKDAHPDAPTPDYFVGANDLTPEDHVRVQAAVQRYTDSSISKCVAGDTLVTTERGLLPVADLYGGEAADTFRPLALRVASLGGEQVTSDFYFGGVRPTLTVALADGHEVTGTPNHRLLVGTPAGLVWKRLDELTPGDEVALKVGANLVGADVSLRGFTQSATRAGYQKTIGVPASLTPALAHFLGAFCAEGSFSHYSVVITNNERPVLERLNQTARMLFGIEGKIGTPGAGKALELRINSKSLCELLHFLGCETGAARKVIPWAVLQSSRESQVAFLSGLYLDGYITPAKVGITLASLPLIRQLQIVLDNLGVQSWISVKHNTQYDRDYYELNAHGREGQRLAGMLSFDEEHKRERAAALLRRTFGPSKTDTIPLEARAAVFAGASKTVRYRHHGYSQALAQRRRLSWFGLRRLAADPEVALTPDLRRVYEEGLHFRAVTAVRAGGEQPVYDLAVPATEAFVANGIVNHNTVNAPNHHTTSEVDRLYRLAYDLGCKGVTYYRDGSRDAVLTHLEEQKEAPKPEPVAPALPATVRARPPVLHGYTRNIKAPEGTVNITVNSDEDGPLEVFINVGRGGSDVAALAEALGRLISLALRIPSPMAQDDRLREMASQLRGIGGSRTIGFGPEQVRSLPDAVGKALDEHLDGLPALQPPPMQLPLPTASDADLHAGKNGHSQADPHHAAYRMTGNLCPECGSTTLVYEEGCRKCLNCGHSEC